MKTEPIHDLVKPLAWLIGKWKSLHAEVKYPSMKTLEYCDTTEFTTLGQPLLNYSQDTFCKDTGKLLHMERGFLKIDKDGCRVALLTAQNFGIVTVEEGLVRDCHLSISTPSSRLLLSPYVLSPVCSMHRCFKLNEKRQLEMSMFMETPKTPLTLHLEALYEKSC